MLTAAQYYAAHKDICNEWKIFQTFRDKSADMERRISFENIVFGFLVFFNYTLPVTFYR
jgi:hypothetical protein